uniref:Pco142081 n=1 Tax=Arundo donax TaxID=35708 RepID=A0A0A9CU74_ARUDO
MLRVGSYGGVEGGPRQKQSSSVSFLFLTVEKYRHLCKCCRLCFISIYVLGMLSMSTY